MKLDVYCLDWGSLNFQIRIWKLWLWPVIVVSLPHWINVCRLMIGRQSMPKSQLFCGWRYLSRIFKPSLRTDASNVLLLILTNEWYESLVNLFKHIWSVNIRLIVFYAMAKFKSLRRWLIERRKKSNSFIQFIKTKIRKITKHFFLLTIKPVRLNQFSALESDTLTQ